MLTSLLLSGAGLDANGRPDSRVEVPRGQTLERRCTDSLRQKYFLYCPRELRESAPLVVSVHGISRNAREHIELLRHAAERQGVVLLAPLFDEQGFPDYQRLGRLGRGPRADLALDRIVGEVLHLTGADTRHMYLFGFSGGGQFVHRYALAYPERVGAAVIGAAGWYTFPDFSVRYPRGIAPSRDLPGTIFDRNRFLRVPMTVIVGSEDIERDPELNRSPKTDRRQGANRMERARNWVNAMACCARECGFDTDYCLRVMPGVGHSFETGVSDGGLDEMIFDSLFGKSQDDDCRVGSINQPLTSEVGRYMHGVRI